MPIVFVSFGPPGVITASASLISTLAMYALAVLGAGLLYEVLTQHRRPEPLPKLSPPPKRLFGPKAA